MEREYGGPEVGWDEGTSGESMRAQRLGGMRVQVERVYEGPEVGWDEGTSGESV